MLRTCYSHRTHPARATHPNISRRIFMRNGLHQATMAASSGGAAPSALVGAVASPAATAMAPSPGTSILAPSIDAGSSCSCCVDAAAGATSVLAPTPALPTPPAS